MMQRTTHNTKSGSRRVLEAVSENGFANIKLELLEPNEFFEDDYFNAIIKTEPTVGIRKSPLPVSSAKKTRKVVPKKILKARYRKRKVTKGTGLSKRFNQCHRKVTRKNIKMTIMGCIQEKTREEEMCNFTNTLPQTLSTVTNDNTNVRENRNSLSSKEVNVRLIPSSSQTGISRRKSQFNKPSPHSIDISYPVAIKQETVQIDASMTHNPPIMKSHEKIKQENTEEESINIHEVVSLFQHSPNASKTASSLTNVKHDNFLNENKIVPCPDCQEIFLNNVFLTIHVKTHPKTKSFFCSFCVSSFHTKLQLDFHSKLHVKPFKCSVCTKSFTLETALKCHITGHRMLKALSKPCKKIANVPVKNSKRLVSVKRSKPAFKCTYCKKQLSTKGNLKFHLKIHTGEKPFECTFCKKKFIHKGHLNRHLKIHTGEKPFECTFCKKKFIRKGDLNRHVRIHTGEKPFECTFCKKKFIRKGDLNQHLRIHTGVKPFECTFCKKKFIHKGHLNDHIRIHTGEKPFECTFCKKQFIHKGLLNRHVRIHTGVKPFQCTFCKKKFVQKGNLNRHVRIHGAFK